MRRASARAQGTLPNALFVWAAVERLPPELTGFTDLHVIMPWGSLLRALVTPRPDILTDLAGTCRPGARFLVALNLHAWRPPVPAVGGTAEPDPDRVYSELAPAYAAAGWHLEQASYLDRASVDALHSSWSRRLRASRPDAFDVLALTGTVP